MGRFILILLVIALLVWVGERYYADHPNREGFFDAIGSSWNSSPAATPSPAANGAPTPTPTPTLTERFNTHRKTLRELSQKVLMSLDESKGYSMADATRTLQQTQVELVRYKPDPNYKNLAQAYDRLMRACAILGQAVQERQSFMQRYQRDAATPPPTAGSGLKLAPLQPSAGMTSTGTDTNAFFQERVITEWQERCDSYYRPALDGLLMAGD